MNLCISCKSRLGAANTTDIKCNSYIQIKSGLGPLFNYEKLYNRYLSRALLLDTLFKSFHVSEGLDNITLPNNVRRNFLEFVKGYNPDSNSLFSKYRQNKFRFYKTVNGDYSLESAEINFNSDLVFPEDISQLYKVVASGTILLDVGSTKAEVQKSFKIDSKQLCDTMQIQDDSEEIWIYFKDNKINKIIPIPYIN